MLLTLVFNHFLKPTCCLVPLPAAGLTVFGFVQECITLNRSVIYDLIASHGDVEDLVFFARLMEGEAEIEIDWCCHAPEGGRERERERDTHTHTHTHTHTQRQGQTERQTEKQTLFPWTLCRQTQPVTCKTRSFHPPPPPPFPPVCLRLGVSRRSTDWPLILCTFLTQIWSGRAFFDDMLSGESTVC